MKNSGSEINLANLLHIMLLSFMKELDIKTLEKPP